MSTFSEIFFANMNDFFFHLIQQSSKNIFIFLLLGKSNMACEIKRVNDIIWKTFIFVR